MEKINLDGNGKRDVGILIENLNSVSEQDADKLFDSYLRGGPAWHRFIKGAYNHPITWWIGLIQIQMQLGMWGPRRKSQAQLVANQLGQALKTIKDNSSGDLLYQGLMYNFKYKKADVLGRFAGGVFTNFSVSGGKLGSNKLHKNAKRVINLSNFLLATYGASIRSVGTGYKKSEHIIQSILTGMPNGPSPYPNLSARKLDKTEEEILVKAQGAVGEISRMSNLSVAPMAIADFCLKPENININGLCK